MIDTTTLRAEQEQREKAELMALIKSLHSKVDELTKQVATLSKKPKAE